MAEVRRFESGATRDTAEGKFDYEGFLSPLVIEEYARYMHANRVLPDGTLRAADNWQLGIPLVAYAKSLWRHHMAFWKAHRGHPDTDPIRESLCAIIFNASGYLHEILSCRAAPKAFPDASDLPDSPVVAALIEMHDEDAPTANLTANSGRNPVSQVTGD